MLSGQSFHWRQRFERSTLVWRRTRQTLEWMLWSYKCFEINAVFSGGWGIIVVVIVIRVPKSSISIDSYPTEICSFKKKNIQKRHFCSAKMRGCIQISNIWKRNGLIRERIIFNAAQRTFFQTKQLYRLIYSNFIHSLEV